jgi:hypothetical protein
MITKVKTNIPTSINKKILNYLHKNARTWQFAYDDVSLLKINKADHGLACVSFSDGVNGNRQDGFDEILNVYGGIILDMVQEQSIIKFKSVKRIYWNWYNQKSIGCQYHQDGLADNKYSIIYNLHTNDGGTSFKIEDNITFEKSIESEAIIFPSKIWHKGNAPIEDLNRFSLNIITEI